MAILIAVPLAMRADPASASGHAVMQQPAGICVIPAEDCSTPKLLNLDQSLYAATPEQATSLRALEKEAVKAVIKEHGLTDGDTAAVQSWGRDEAIAKLFMLLLDAIADESRDADQQNAVDWLTRIAGGQPQSRSALAAQAAGREYVKWAGLNAGTYETLVNNSSTTKNELTAFLDDNPQPLVPPHFATGYCAYRSPEPFASEYTGYNNPTCFAPCPSIVGCNPPTPSYDQFVKWGEAVATYKLLTSADYAKASHRIGLAAAAGVAAAATVGAQGAYMAAAWAVRVAHAAVQNAAVAATMLTPLAAAAAVATVVIIAVAIAVTQGVFVVNASQLPGQLAELIIGARTTAPDLKSLTDSSDGVTSLFSMVVGATLPTPRQETCDNSGAPRGVTYGGGWYVVSGAAPCLNPSPIPPPSSFDPQFLVRADGSPTTTRSATITWKDSAAGTTTTARLHKNWFVTETNGAVAQTLRITYTDWDGKQQHGYLLGPDDDGDYTFVSLHVGSSTEFDFDTCVADGVCMESDTLKYLGPASEKLSAKVEPYAAPTGTPKYDLGDEGEASSFDANGFKPGNAQGAVSYQWRFQNYGQGLFGHPSYDPPVAGAVVSHTWERSGQFSVELTATDSAGRTGTTTFAVNVGNVPPTLVLVPDCSQATPICLPRTGLSATPLRISGSFDDAGVMSELTVAVDWGDGGGVQLSCIGGTNLCGNSPIDLRRSPNGQYYVLDVSHSYTAPGTYYGRVSVFDRAGGADSEAFVITIGGRPAAPADLYAEVAPAAGLGSGQVKLAWSAPASNGATITDYRIERRPGDSLLWSTVPDAVSTATTATLDDLGIFSTSLRVTAVTATGNGPPSDPIQITPQFGPNAPVALTASVAPEPGVGSGQVKLSWGHLIGYEWTGHFVEWSVDGTTWTTVPVDGTATSYTVDGLANFTPHRFRVSARNSIGVSPPSEIQATPVGTPAAPGGLAATVAPAPGLNSGGLVRLSWQAAPAAAAVTDYVIESSLDGATWTTVNDGVSTATTYTVTGLTNGTPYRFRVAAKNTSGLGPSSPAIAATPVWRPGMVTPLTGEVAPAAGVGSGQVKLSWTAPTDSGSPITDYIILIADRYVTMPFGEMLNWTTIDDGVSTATTYTVGGLGNGTVYWFQVVAKNAVGNGLALFESAFVPRGVPNAPGGLTPSTAPAPDLGSAQVKLTWNAPWHNGAAITDYVIESSVDGQTWTRVDDGVSTATTHTVGGLTNGAEYSFRVAAVNAVGDGSWTAPVESTPVWIPAAPADVKAVAPLVAGLRQARLTWSAPATNGAAITDYVIESSLDGTTWTTIDDGVSTATTHTVSGLSNALLYQFRIAAKNVAGVGPWSASVRPRLVVN